MNPADYPGTGALPDALAFVKPNRSEFWIHLESCDEPQTAGELEDAVEWSGATIYRMLADLEAIGLVETAMKMTDAGPRDAYQAATPEKRPVWERQAAEGVVR
ncbi:helix-turn-helix domain-containing protein [Natronosalvus halobius]|uniref:helix-turn-helix domain-containing protein n=1 Tax=Natronosalvus halobius TaxID=2953746 RepID=UPI00209E993B|nr:helix-turn-helix domain-containing protein [Natronosalvus halobius]USZ73742.1 helix-turn-helix transcriptional regulator [Natronosalvus halobius]